MQETIRDILHLIYTQLFMGYGLVTLVLICLSLFLKDSLFLKKFDKISCNILIYSGILFAFLFVLGLIIFFGTADEEAKNNALGRMFGMYWFGYWLQPILWITITQLHRSKKVREKKWLRFIMCFPLMISIEMFVIITTSFHRDYLPGSWQTSEENEWLYMLPGLFGKIIQYCTLVGLYFLVAKTYNHLREKSHVNL